MLIPVALLCCSPQLEAAKVSARYFKNCSRLLSAMNGYLPSAFQYHVPDVSLLTRFQGNAHNLSGIHPGFTAQPFMQLLPHQHALPKSLNPTQYLLHNFAFTNSDRYHQSHQALRKADIVSVAKEADRISLKDELLRESSNSAGSTPHSSREPSPTHQDLHVVYAPIEEIDMAEMRGVKRHTDQHYSPQKKRSRGQDGGGGNYKSNMAQGRLNEMEARTQYIWQYYETRHQSKEVYDSKMRLREALYTLMKGVFPYCGVYIVGSSMNGFGSRSSDMDMCLMLCQSEINQKKEATEILRILLKSFQNCTFLQPINLIRAKVPILKFHDRISNIEVDLNINNAVGIRNTHLLNAYSRLDWRVSPLVLFVKHWASCQQINDASQGTISSYSLVMMVLHYLQISDKGAPPVLPSLQQMYPNKFSNAVDIRLLTLNDKLPPYSSPNTASLGELFTGFLEYYATKFNFQDEAISVRLGKKLPKSLMVRGDNPNQWKFICIEEPFDCSNTARSVYDSFVFQRIYRVIRQSHARLRMTGTLNNIINVPV